MDTHLIQKVHLLLSVSEEVDMGDYEEKSVNKNLL